MDKANRKDYGLSSLTDIVFWYWENIKNHPGFPSDTAHAVPNGKSLKEMRNLISKHNLADDNVVVMAYILFNRISSHPVKMDNVVLLVKDNLEVMVAVCLCIADKYMTDVAFDSYTYSTLAGVDVSLFSQWEMKVWKHLNFEVGVGEIEFNKNVAELRDVFDSFSKLVLTHSHEFSSTTRSSTCHRRRVKSTKSEVIG